MLLFAALVAGSFSFGGRIANDIDPLALTTARFLFAALCLGVLAAATGRLRREDLAAPWRYAVLGGLIGGYFVLMFEGLKTAAPVSTSAVFTLVPLMAGGFGYLLMGQAMTRTIALALMVGGAGALWVIFRGDPQALLAFEVGRGEMIFFAGCVLHAIYIPMVPRLNRGEAVVVFGGFTFAIGSLLLLLTGWNGIVTTDWAALPLQVWAVLAYLVVFASVVSLSLVQYASLRLKAAKVMAYTFLVPTFVTAWEFVLTGALPPSRLLVGVGLTALALVILLREGRGPS